MALFNWSDRFSVGIPLIDSQHKKLVGYLNTLYEAMRAGKGNEALAEILDNLVNYTQTHFKAEEKLMQSHQYPEFPNHYRQHEAFVRKLTEIQQQFNGGGMGVTLKVANFLKEWLSQHILVTDRKYIPYINK